MFYFHENNILVYLLVRNTGMRLISCVVEEYEPIVHKVQVHIRCNLGERELWMVRDTVPRSCGGKLE